VAEVGPIIEKAAEAVHIRWVRLKQTQGIESIQTKDGEPLMVPYAELSEDSKEKHRQTVQTVVDAIIDAGYNII
jgi:hypothetical protein